MTTFGSGTFGSGTFGDPIGGTPVIGPPDPSIVIGAPQLPDPSDPYGVDLVLNPQTGDLVVTPAGGLAFVQGPDNVVQALTMRVRTYPGELPLHPDYGSQLQQRLIGMKAGDDELARSLASQQFAQVLQTDDRFLSAIDVDAAQDPADPQTVRVSGRLLLAQGDALDVEDLALGQATVLVDEAGDEIDLVDVDELDDPFDDDELEGLDLGDVLDPDA